MADTNFGSRQACLTSEFCVSLPPFVSRNLVESGAWGYLLSVNPAGQNRAFSQFESGAGSGYRSLADVNVKQRQWLHIFSASTSTTANPQAPAQRRLCRHQTHTHNPSISYPPHPTSGHTSPATRRPPAPPPCDPAATRSRPSAPHPNPLLCPLPLPRARTSQVPNQSEAALPPSPLRPHAPRRDGRAPPRLLHPPPRRRRGLRLLRRDPRGAPVRLLRPRGAGAPLPPPGPAPPPPRGPRQAPRRRGRGGELRVRAVGGGRRERHPRADGLRPREAGEDLLRRGRRRVLRQPHRPARGEDPAHRRDRQVVRAAAARRQLPQCRRRQLPRGDRAGDRRRVRERLQLAHGHRGRHRHLRRAARVAGPRADRAARPEDDRRQERPPQDTARPGAHRRLHRAVRPRRLQLYRHERPEADRGDRVRVRVARRPARSLTGLRRPSSPLKLSCYCLKEWHESSGNVGPVPFRPADQWWWLQISNTSERTIFLSFLFSIFWREPV